MTSPLHSDDDQDTIDGRYLPAVNCYASTCDGCGELTMHETMWMDIRTQLGYCPRCTPGAMREANYKP